jgi:hypothetical protein
MDYYNPKNTNALSLSSLLPPPSSHVSQSFILLPLVAPPSPSPPDASLSLSLSLSLMFSPLSPTGKNSHLQALQLKNPQHSTQAVIPIPLTVQIPSSVAGRRERERERERERDWRKAKEFVFLKDASRAWINFMDSFVKPIHKITDGFNWKWKFPDGFIKLSEILWTV